MAKRATLETQIEQRKKQAKDRNISNKAFKVARYLGYLMGLHTDNTSGSKYIFSASDLTIEFRSGEIYRRNRSMEFRGLTIYYRDKPVFVEDGSKLETYIPGKWEKALDALQPKTKKGQKLYEEREREDSKIRQQVKETRERKNWGL